MGAVVGKDAEPSVFSGCRNTGDVYSGFNANNNSHVAGGLAGMVRDVKFTDCVSTGKIASYQDFISGPVGGFAGFVLSGAEISGGEARPAVSIKKVSSPSLWSYGLVIGAVRTDGKTSVSNVKVGGSITVSGVPEKIDADNFEAFLSVNRHFTYKPEVSGCEWMD